MRAKLHLAHKPTPMWRNSALDALLGLELWVKRDDMTAGAEAGNKIRKLEYLLADALELGADTLITCGAAQSNHARATALLGRQLGLDAVLLLRVRSEAEEASQGNLLLSRLSGARVRCINPEQYRDRTALMAEEAARLTQDGRSAYVIPEGGSNGLGALGYVDAVKEIREQQQLGICSPVFDTVVCACGSGGTAAGLALGIAAHGGAQRVDAFAICDDTAYFQRVTEAIASECRALVEHLPQELPLSIHDEFKGPSYGEMSQEQQRFLLRVARESGLVLDPVYSGKALFGLAHMNPKPKRALFIHTGGLPGLLAVAGDWPMPS